MYKIGSCVGTLYSPGSSTQCPMMTYRVELKLGEGLKKEGLYVYIQLDSSCMAETNTTLEEIILQLKQTKNSFVIFGPTWQEKKNVFLVQIQ